MTKTVHLTNAYHPRSGGIRTFYGKLIEGANRQERPLRLIVPADRHGVEDVGAHARIYHVRAPRSPWIDSRYRVLFPPQFLLPRGRIADILRAEQPDVVEVCDKYSLCYLGGVLRKGWIAGLRRPVIVGLTCERMDDNVDQYLQLGTPGRRWASWYMRQVYLPQFDTHIAISSYTAAELREQMAKHPRRVDVLPLGVDTGCFRPARRSDAVRRSLLDRVSGNGRTSLLFYAGRLAREKNIELLIATLERLNAGDPPRKYHLLVAGDGPRRKAFLADAGVRTPGRVHLLGHLHRERLADTLASVDVFVHPNPREPFGIGPLEALASGVALVGPDAGGVLTYACRETAWLARPEPEAFARAVREVAGDPERRRSKLARAVARAGEYAWPRTTARFFQLYDELTRTVRQAPGMHPPQALRLHASNAGRRDVRGYSEPAGHTPAVSGRRAGAS